ncbi:MAG TPA: hypothetical protein PLU52_01595 [Opitutaceae bacterium]|nr:hypothetical protein [Opitutaceae bacterium]HND60372.1 hypothetical protein [Opitutaceae bacterium]
MRHLLSRLVHRPAVRFGLESGGRGPCRNPRFVSFLAQSNRKALDTDLHDAVLRGRKVARQLLFAVLAGGAAWILLESAHALTVF